MGLVYKVEGISTVFSVRSFCDDCGFCVPTTNATILGCWGCVLFFFRDVLYGNTLRRNFAVMFLKAATTILASSSFVRNANHLLYVRCLLFLFTTWLVFTLSSLRFFVFVETDCFAAAVETVVISRVIVRLKGCFESDLL